MDSKLLAIVFMAKPPSVSPVAADAAFAPSISSVALRIRRDESAARATAHTESTAKAREKFFRDRIFHRRRAAHLSRRKRSARLTAIGGGGGGAGGSVFAHRGDASC